MIKKCLLYLICFIFLTGLNFYTIYTISGRNKKALSIEKTLNEIGKSIDLNKQFSVSAAPFVLGGYRTDIKLADARSSNLRSFFRRHNSSLYDYADYIVKISDKYQFDYRLLPAIAMQESNLCHYIPENSNNCWGWGIYGNTVTKFNSYEEAIETVARGIKREYIDKGLLTASAIMEKYTPNSTGSWAKGVNTFLNVLE